MALLAQLGVLLVAVILQAAWPRMLRPAGVTPDLTLAVVLTCAIAASPGTALLLALIGGTLLDLLSALPPATNVASHVGGAALVLLLALDRRRERPWLAVVLPPLGTAIAYLVAGGRLWLAGWPVAWPALLGMLPVAVLLVTGLTFCAWLLLTRLKAPGRPSVRL